MKDLCTLLGIILALGYVGHEDYEQAKADEARAKIVAAKQASERRAVEQYRELTKRANKMMYPIAQAKE